MRALVDAQPGTFGVYARNLTTDETVAVNADQVLPAESAAKTFVLIHYSRLVTAGVVDPAARVRLDQGLRLLGTGVLRYLADGLEPTLDDFGLAHDHRLRQHRDRTAAAGHRRAGRCQPDDGPARVPHPRLDESITFESALAGEPFSTSSPRDLAEVYTELDERSKAMLFRQQHLIGLPRKLPAMSQADDFGFTLPVRVYNKTGNGLGNFIDSGLFETDEASWVLAAMATEQTDFAARPEDAAPATFADISERIYAAWGLPDP